MIVFRKHAPWLMLLVAFVLATMLFTVGPQKVAHAAQATHALPMKYCSGNPPCPGIDGIDPYTDGCAGGKATWYVVESNYIYNGNRQRIGYEQLWYSATCNTNWARTVPYSAQDGLNVDLRAWAYGDWQYIQGPLLCVSYCWDAATNSYDLRTDQYYIPGPAGAEGCVLEGLDAWCAGAFQPI